MFRRTLIGLLATTAATVSLVAGVPAQQAQADVGVAVVTLTYSDARAGEFKSAVASGVAVWNASVTNVRIQKAAAGARADITVIADDGWPRATLGPVRPGGSATVWMGRQAVNDGYSVVRIAAHELGHSLGLPDIKPGPCSSLMSGSTGGVSCTNTNPNASERSRVQNLYAGAATPASNRIVVDD
ncbi:snapalysin family zinc-dependent metalloprotease [Actinophytocola sp.]|uniref:snapalysin family zinc-dependent metalloprotease n=1 Tax=Actinophytocola sp. TaxID=1872138 RepID=UPI002ECFD626